MRNLMLSTIQLVYITAPNLKEAKKISRILLKEQLVACTNILPNMQSMFWWKGKIQESKEVVIIAKSQKSKIKKIIQKIEKIHSYEVPCVLALKVSDGSKAYMRWLRNPRS